MKGKIVRIVGAFAAISMMLAAFAAPIPAAAAGNYVVTINDCTNGTLVANVNQNFMNDADSAVGGGYWAIDKYTKNMKVYDLGNGTFCLVAVYDGTFKTLAGDSPQGTGTVSASVTGKMNGGYAYLITNATFSLGSFPDVDLQGDTSGNHNSFDTLGAFFSSYHASGYIYWGWVYSTCGNGTWGNVDTGNFGDITGDPVACPAYMPLKVKNLYAFYNPGDANRDVCFILSSGLPTRDDIQRLCFTEYLPDWYQGAVELTHGNVFDNGTNWGYYEGDATVSAYSGAKRLPLFSADKNDLYHLAKRVSWTQN